MRENRAHVNIVPRSVDRSGSSLRGSGRVGCVEIGTVIQLRVAPAEMAKRERVITGTEIFISLSLAV